MIIAKEPVWLEMTGGACVYEGTTKEGGGVKVGKRVDVGTMLNCAAKVGSTVEVGGGTGVGGASTTRSVPGETCTSGEYTQPLL